MGASKAGLRRRSDLLLSIGMVFSLLLPSLGFSATPPSVKSATSPSGQEPITRIRQLLRQENFAEAEKQSRALLASYEATKGKDSVEAAQAMDLVVEALIGLGKMAEPEAKALADRAVEMMEKRSGPESLDVARALAVSGKLRFFAGDYPGARTVCERAAAIFEKNPPPDELDRVPTLDCLAMTYSKLGPLDQARETIERAIAIQEKALGPDDPALAKPLNHLAIINGMLGEYDKVFPLLKRCIAILEKRLGPDNPALGSPLNNLAMIYKLSGNYTEAVPVLERTLKIRTQALGPDHYEVGLSTQVLGNLHVALADYARAETYLRKALDIFERSVGRSHSEVGSTLGGLGRVLAQQDRLTEAAPLFRRCIEVLEKAYGPGNIETAYYMLDLANVQLKLGQLEPAGDLYRKALAVQDKALGPEHPDRADGYQGFGSYLLAKGELPQAQDLFTKALAIREKMFGDGFEVAETLESLAMAQWALGNVKTAFGTALRSEESIRRHLLRTAPALTERQALRYESRLGGGIATAASILASRPEMAASPEPAARLWDEVVRSRAVVLDEIARRHQAVLQLEDPATMQLSANLAQARSRLSHLSLVGPDKDHADRFRTELQRGEAAVEGLERRLAEQSRAYREEEAARLAGWNEARTALPARTALVAYLRFDRLQDPGKAGDSSGRRILSGTPSYAVLSFEAEDSAPRFVLLGSAKEIDARVAAWRREILNPASAQSDKSYRDAALELSRKIWDPVAPRLKGARLVFLVPDASLNLVSFATLARPGNRFLIEEEATLHYLSSERDLLQQPRAPRPGATALVLGGPDFDSPASEDLAAAAAAPEPEFASNRSAPAAYRSSVPSCEAFRTMRFSPLPNTVAEADEVASLLSKDSSSSPASGGIMKLTGKLASERFLKDLSAGRAILHIATHGFFLSRDCLDSGTPGGGGAGASPFLDNPLLFSGLAMAGANLRQGGPAAPEGEDGILTAAEVASLDLRGVEWAVLSACETGLGPIQVGEGVLGLRRAFQIAGARTLIMSLWSVADVPARDWIHNLYASRISGAASAEAVRDAALKMLQARRKAGVSTHPSAWGAFIASGDWR